MAYQGFVDPIQHDKLIGWAWDDKQPAAHVSVQIFLDGRLWETRAAFRHRPDLQRAGIGQGDHAFGIDLPVEVFDGQPHRFEVMIVGTSTHLSGSPMTFQSRYEGRIEGADGKRVWGVALDAARPSQPVAVAVLLNGKFRVETLASGGKFEVAIPPFLDAFARLRIDATVAGRPLGDGQVARVHRLELLRALRQLGSTSLASGSAYGERSAVRALYEILGEAESPYRLIRDTVEGLVSANRPAASSLPVDVIIPVFEGEEQSIRAIESVLGATCECPFELVVCYDNPDNAGLLSRIQELRQRTPFTLLVNEKNAGFIVSVNRGMAEHADRDVVLLNSDAAVHGNWLERLRNAAYAQPSTGTATPFSNNATICSYPRFAMSNSIPPDLSLAGMDDLFAAANRGRTLEIPTAVGFCMYIRRDCLNETGGFDAATFGAGYGEENDFCQRAATLGWRHVLAAGVFVEHEGGVSFGSDAAARCAQNYQKLSARWPLYDSEVRRFLSADPVLPLRRNVDLARARTSAQPCVALASNLLGGGTEKHVQETAATSKALGEAVVYLRVEESRRVQIHLPDRLDLSNLVFCLPDERAEFCAALKDLQVRRVHFHQIIGAPPDLFEIASELRIPYECTLHDYAWVCPQVNLIDDIGHYCGEPDLKYCEACLGRLGTHKDWPTFPMLARNVEELRALSTRVLDRAEAVFTPSEDAARRFARYFPASRIYAAPHDQVAPSARTALRKGGEEVRVVLIGSIGLSKGYEVLHDCARHARQNHLPLRFCVVGATLRDRELEAFGNVEITGDYVEESVQGLVARQAGHLAFFPNVWPETFSYTLTVAFQAGLFPVAFDLGAIAERIKRHKFGRLLELGATSESINRALIEAAGG